MTLQLFHGDRRAVLATMAPNSIAAIVTDPPYNLRFMGHAWDRTGIAFDKTFWTECVRVLKPGGHLVACGGTRTYHRLTCAIEDAGMGIRDCLMWVYSTGFPKSHNISLALQKAGVPHDPTWHGWGTALKPAYEPILLARKPCVGTMVDNIQQYGVGGLNIDACRIPSQDDQLAKKYASLPLTARTNAIFHADNSIRKVVPHSSGRWPANILFDDEAGAILGASRFFYCAKASATEREAGLTSSSDGRANTHPTVKPLALMRYLITLVTPPGETILDPFMGRGTTGCAAQQLGFDFIGIDQSAEYVALAHERIRYWTAQPFDKRR